MFQCDYVPVRNLRSIKSWFAKAGVLSGLALTSNPHEYLWDELKLFIRNQCPTSLQQKATVGINLEWNVSEAPKDVMPGVYKLLVK